MRPADQWTAKGSLREKAAAKLGHSLSRRSGPSRGRLSPCRRRDLTRPVRVVAFTKYGAEAASTRQRLLQYLPALRAAGIDVEWYPLLSDDYVRGLTRGTRTSKIAIARRYAERIRQILRVRGADVLWIYAELFPYLPAAFERLAFAGRVPVVYDFDDAFFHQYDAARRPLVRRVLAGKLEPLLRGAAACACGNAYLRDYADRFCDHAVILPTVVDTDVYVPALGERATPLSIGWIGTPSTWDYVRPLLPLLAGLAAERGIRVRMVGAGAAAEGSRFEGLDLVDWREETEVAEVKRMDIGIMPLPDEAWARGKSGYKLIQYMACGLPVVASPVGVNTEIVEEGETGFLARTPEEWRHALVTLLDNAALRRRMGESGRRRAEAHYSLKQCAPRMVELFLTAAKTSAQ